MATRKSTDLQIGTDVLIDTPLKPIICARCRQLVLQGELTGCTVRVEPTLLDLNGELAHRLLGGNCFQLASRTGRLYLETRTVHDITKKRKKHEPEPAVVAEHRHDDQKDTNDEPPF